MTDRLPARLRLLAEIVDNLDRGQRLQLALAVDVAFDRISNTAGPGDELQTNKPTNERPHQ